ncbi:MAG: DUF4105 domain-containing protein [Dysgonamonadaceae bacterium]|nr:DUF4105 domain-containing protein [Dysgonamonadaceae bacterium]
MKRILFFALLPLFPALLQSQTNRDLQVSLLTVMPRSKAVYTIYGHTALRLYDPSRSVDAVLNWGTFDEDKPNFIYHFLLGKTDYFLSATSTQYFIDVYEADNSTVVEQVVNIPDSLKTSILQMMETFLRPENTEYRYNIFFDNCTTRPRDIIEKVCGGTFVYPQQNEAITIRKLVHGCTKHYPWMEFGIDLIIGNGADSLISLRTEMFLPERLMNLLSRSLVKTADREEYPAVLSEKTILQAAGDDEAKAGFLFLKPLAVCVFVFLVYLVLCVSSFPRRNGGRKRYRLPFAVLFLLAGLSGCLLAGLVFLSEHPCTSPNWNIAWLHPLHLVGFAGFLLKKFHLLFRCYHIVNFVLLSGFLLGWHWIPQELNVAFIPLVGSLWLASGYQVFCVLRR